MINSKVTIRCKKWTDEKRRLESGFLRKPKTIGSSTGSSTFNKKVLRCFEMDGSLVSAWIINDCIY